MSHCKNDTAQTSALLEKLRAVLDPAGVLEGEDAVQRAAGWSRMGRPLAVLRPRSTAEVAALVRACSEAGVPVVPWGGRTGLVSGGCADGAMAMSFERMNRIEAIDPDNCTMTVEAGCIVQNAYEAAEAQGLFFPLDLGARGSATIGGTIATNAGGNRVVRFGMMRDMVLGIEAVLADGSVVSSLHPFIKNNTGYDIKQLFIGSEGTLGIVTRAVLRLRPRLVSQNVALLAVDRFPDLVQVLRRLESLLGGQLSAFEVMWRDFYELVATPPARGRPILPAGHCMYALVEALGGDIEADAERFQSALATLMQDGAVSDAVVAQSQAECDAIWALRDDGEQVQRVAPIISFDVSLRLSTVERFEATLRKMLTERWPQTKLILFGHIGDGNIHVVVGCCGDSSAEMRDAITKAVYGALSEVGGSVSAEHGIGLDKLPYLPLTRSPAELAVMRTLKRSLDPHNILNPGKVVAADDAHVHCPQSTKSLDA